MGGGGGGGGESLGEEGEEEVSWFHFGVLGEGRILGSGEVTLFLGWRMEIGGRVRPDNWRMAGTACLRIVPSGLGETWGCMRV